MDYIMNSNMVSYQIFNIIINNQFITGIRNTKTEHGEYVVIFANLKKHLIRQDHRYNKHANEYTNTKGHNIINLKKYTQKINQHTS